MTERQNPPGTPEARAAQLAEDATWITLRWDDLAETRLPGTPRPWRQQHIAPRRATDDLVRRRKGAPLANAPAPLDLDTLDLMDRILRTVRQAALAIAAELDHRHVLDRIAGHRADHPREYLAYIARHHRATEQATRDHLERRLRSIRNRMTEQFAERSDGQYLRADCPSCHRPGLRIRLIGPDHAQQPVIVCEHDGCNPATGMCGTWWRGRPAWPFHEWEWLDKVIGA